MRKLKMLIIGILAVTVMSGCGNRQSETADTAASTKESAESPAAASDEAKKTETAPEGQSAIFSQSPTGEKIVLATNNTSDGRDVWLQERAAAAGFNVEIVPLGGADITARVISEVNNPTINVIWGPSEDQFASMVNASAMAPFTPDWAGVVEGISKDNGYSWPYEIQPKLLVCNPDVYTEETTPKSYQDLWEKEEYHGKYAVPTTFDGNTNRAIVAGILVQYLDPKGELGVSEEGWKAIKLYFDNGYKTPKGENDFGNMASGKVPITFTFASGLKVKSESFGVTPIVVYSEVGEPTGTNQIGVVAGKKQDMVKESMRFANWLGSGEVMGAYSAENGNIVANPQAEDQMSPIAKNIKKNYKAQEIDWEYVNSMMDDWVAKIQLEIY